MKNENPATCAVCGRAIDRGAAPDRSGRCERCAESDSARLENRSETDADETLDQPGESGPAAALEQLRDRYHEARALVATGKSDPYHRGQLDWIFGIGGDDARANVPLDARTSELVVLWLEDLIRHLEELAGRGPDPSEPDSKSPNSHAAVRLHAATRAFEYAFRRAANLESRP